MMRSRMIVDGDFSPLCYFLFLSLRSFAYFQSLENALRHEIKQKQNSRTTDCSCWFPSNSKLVVVVFLFLPRPWRAEKIETNRDERWKKTQKRLRLKKKLTKLIGFGLWKHTRQIYTEYASDKWKGFSLKLSKYQVKT